MTHYYPHTVFTQFIAATDDTPSAMIKAECSGVNASVLHGFAIGYDQVNHVQAVHRLLANLIDVSAPYIIHTAAYSDGYAHIIEFIRE